MVKRLKDWKDPSSFYELPPSHPKNWWASVKKYYSLHKKVSPDTRLHERSSGRARGENERLFQKSCRIFGM